MSVSQPSTFENLFVDALEYCLKAMTSFQACTIATTSEAISGEIIATVGLSSGLYLGSISLIFPKPAFLKISNALLGENDTEITATNSDAAAELLNIIYGYAKTTLNKTGNNFEPSIPTVFTGNGLTINKSKNGLSFYNKVSIGSEEFFLTGTLGIASK